MLSPDRLYPTDGYVAQWQLKVMFCIKIFFYDSFLVQESLFVIFVGWVLSKNVIRRHLKENKVGFKPFYEVNPKSFSHIYQNRIRSLKMLYLEPHFSIFIFVCVFLCESSKCGKSLPRDGEFSYLNIFNRNVNNL